jgi:protein TonB
MVDRFAGAPLGPAGSRWVSANSKSRRPFGMLPGSAAAHVLLLLLVLAFVRAPPLPGEPEQQIVDMVFEAQSPAVVAPAGVLPAEMLQQPAATPSEPAPQPLDQTAQPPQPQPPQPLSLPRPLPEPPPTAVAAPRQPTKPTPPRQAAQRSTPAPATALHAPAAPATATATAPNPAGSSMAPARAAPAAGTPARDAAAAAVDGAWQQALGIWLAAHKTYPEQARRRGEEGRVAIRFTVNRSGRVLDVSVVGGSGSAALDAAASTLLRGAALPPFVASMPQEQVTVTVQLRYFLTP